VTDPEATTAGVDAGGFIVVRDRRRSKPLSREELERLVRAGRVSDTDGLRQRRDGAWVDLGPIRDVAWLRPSDAAPATVAATDLAAGAPALPMRFPAWRVVVAFALAIAVDVVNVFFALIPPIYITVDVVAAVAIWFVLGRPSLLVGVLLIEAVPGIGVIPFWTVVVGLIIFTGSIPARGMGDVENRGPVGKVVAFLATKLQPKDAKVAAGPKRSGKPARK